LGRLAWSQLRFRAARTIALLAGMLLAATAFTVLTAASRTSQLRTVGTVSAHFSPAYDILVRPKGSRTALETRTGTVQPNFLSGIYGGISLAQYHRIQQIPGVQVAAPIAMVGYTLIRAGIPVLLSAADNERPGRQLYRYTTTWVSAGGTTRVVQPSSYLYLTPNRLGLNNQGDAYEDLPGGSKATVCSQSASQPASPFDAAAQSNGWFWSQVDGDAGAFTLSPQPHQAFAIVNWSFPMLIAAVDPAEEAKLDGFSHAVTSGRYLAENASGGHAANGQATFPVLAASASGIGEYAVTQVQRLPAPAGPVSLTAATMSAEAATPGQTVLTVRTSAEQAYQQVLTLTRSDEPVDDYLTAGTVRYRRAANDSLTPVQVNNPVSVWRSGDATSALVAPPMDETESQYRSLDRHQQTGEQASGGAPEMQLVGVFSLAVGVAGLTLLTAVTVAYRGVVVGSLLGDAVAVQVRGVDYVAVGATVLLGVLAVADVVFLNIRERASELATIRSFGWRESSLARLVVTEGAMIGVAGSLAGAVLGLVAAGEFTGQLPPRLFAAAAAAAGVGVLVTAGAALVPAQLLRRLPTAYLLAEE
jgi:putative ABC transport system permease protein